MPLPKNVIKRNGELVAFNPEKITFAVMRAAIAVGGRDRGQAEEVTADALKRLSAAVSVGSENPSVEEIQDAVEKALIERGHAKTAKAYILYRYEHALKREKREGLTYSRENIPYKKLWEALDWAVDNRCATTPQLEEILQSGRFPALIAASEEFYDAEVEEAISVVKERIEGLRLVIIAGPSSSGKTTATIKLSRALEGLGKRLVPLNADNYFFDRDQHPRDPWGDYDYETPQALDIARLNADIGQLVKGEKARAPFYDFKLGKRLETGPEMKLEKADILLLDSLHGLYEPMTESVDMGAKARLYIETLAQLKDSSGAFVRWADVRMMRRMLRDSIYRNHDPRQTLLHWYLVRRAELQYIVPRLREADAVINSYLAYELPIMKARLGELMPRLAKELESLPERQDARDRAARVAKLFGELSPWGDESLVPLDSPLREFIGGSCYSY